LKIRDFRFISNLVVFRIMGGLFLRLRQRERKALPYLQKYTLKTHISSNKRFKALYPYQTIPKAKFLIIEQIWAYDKAKNRAKRE